MNLCVNARDAMPSGGTLSLETSNVQINEHFASMQSDAKPGPYVAISVIDTGTGMTPHVRERIFEPFFTTKPLEKGTGLGLSTSLSIVKSHGGFLTVRSGVGQGTEIKVYLPARQSDDINLAEPEPEVLPMGSGELVLMVDDEASILNIAKQTLQTFGFEVLTANDGAEAVAVCAQNLGKIKVMVTDLMMPIMDGAATIQAVRQLDAQLKVIAASGLGSDDNVIDPEKLNADAFLEKPFTAERLVKTLHEVLQRK